MSQVPPARMATINQRVAAARERLRAADLLPAEADLSARLLAQHLLEWDTAQLLTSGNEHEPDGFADQFDALVARREAREPLHYIVGHREFWGLKLEVSPAVLIPRPETELIVEAVLALAPSSRLFTMIDACTGCGNVAVAVAKERPNARIVATDISETALEVARRNAARHGVEVRVTFVQADVFGDVSGPVDLITANPPYVPERHARGLQPEVGGHEPHVALFGGGYDGLRLLERIVGEAPRLLRPGGHLVCEFGFGQEIEVEEILNASADLTLVELKRDLQGLARTAVAVRA
jgi:release factor glutamine methyltransferase